MDEIDFAGPDRHRRGRARRGADALHRRARSAGPTRDPDDAPAVDIAVDPLEGTNLVAHGQAGAITVLAASEAGGLTHAPDTYMEKLCVGPVVAGKVDIREPPDREPAARSPRRSAGGSGDITVVILERPRHDDLIAEVREAGARIKLIGDGDLSAAISLRRVGHRRPRGHGHRRRARRASSRRRRCAASAARSRPASATAATRSASAATGWATATRTASTGRRTSRRARTSSSPRPASRAGDLLQGVRFFGGGARTHSLVMAYQTKQVRFVDTVHMFDRDSPPRVRL